MRISSFRRRRGAVVIVLAVVVTMVLPVAAQDFPADTIAVVKADESPSNAEIAVRLSEETPLPAVDTVVIGRDDEFADSLASGVLQSTSPLLLVPSAGPVPVRVRDELARLAPQRVILLGGEAALRPAVADELAGLGYAVERRAGASRFETAAAVARTDAGGVDTVILARAFPSEGATDPTQGFADALAAGGMAAEFGWPVLLTQTEVLTGTTRDYLVEAGVQQVEIMGGTAAISAAVEQQINAMGIATERLSGNSRAETAIAVASKRGDDSAAAAAHVLLVQGQTADAWAGGFAAAAHSALLDAPIVLAAEDQLPQPTVDWLQGGATGGTSAFAVVPDDGSPVLTCVTVPTLCEDARLALGLPPVGPVSFSPAPGSTVDWSQQITATFAAPTSPEQVLFGGTCATGSSARPSGQSRTQVILAVDVGTPPGPCMFTIDFTPEGGERQQVEVTFTSSGEPSIELLSLTAEGIAAGGLDPSASRDGLVVAFASDGPLVPGVAAGDRHSYVAVGGGVELLDVTPQGTPGNPAPTVSGLPDVFTAADGRYIAFTSSDTTLDPQAQPSSTQNNLYVRDRQAETTRFVSVGLDGEPLRGGRPSLSADGRIVTYIAQGQLDQPTSCACSWIWWHDLVTGEVDYVKTPGGEEVDGGAGSRPQLSADGTAIAFQTRAALLPADDNDGGDVYLYTRATGALELVSVGNDGTAGTPQVITSATGISEDARYVAFAYGGGLVAGDDAELGHVYLRDRQAGTTVRISQGGTGQFTNDSGRVQISEDGAWVAFTSTRAIIEGNKGGCGVYRYDVAGGGLDRVDLGQVGIPANNCPSRVDISASGSVMFDHLGTLHAGDDSHQNVNGGYDVYRSGPQQ